MVILKSAEMITLMHQWYFYLHLRYDKNEQVPEPESYYDSVYSPLLVDGASSDIRRTQVFFSGDCSPTSWECLSVII